jgi:hypothetical protein
MRTAQSPHRVDPGGQDYDRGFDIEAASRIRGWRWRSAHEREFDGEHDIAELDRSIGVTVGGVAAGAGWAVAEELDEGPDGVGDVEAAVAVGVAAQEGVGRGRDNFEGARSEVFDETSRSGL